MSPEEYRQLNQVFLAALELPKEQRAAFLTQACAGDAESQRRVEAMLYADSETGHLIDRPAHSAASELLIDESSDLPNGGRLGHYRLTREIGRGGMGAVYLAHDERLDRRVALKVLPARFTSDAERVRRFQREARAASALNHPNILTIFDIGREDGSHYIATEFVEGQTLRALIGSGELTLGATLDVGMQIASALDAAHKVGIIHRDIKPENVMLRPDGYVKVLDFGLAKLIEQDSSPRQDETEATASSVFETRAGMILGTVAYMSPEQARGQKVDARSDLFSLGVVLYELISGARPFTGATRNHVLVAILDHDPAPLAGGPSIALPPELPRVVRRALAKERDERYQTANDLSADLRLVKEELISAAHSSIPNRVADGDRNPAITDTNDTPTVTGQISWLGNVTLARLGVAAALALAVIAGLGFTLSRWLGWGTPVQQPFERFQAAKFTATGNAATYTISPDGKYVAYVSNEPGNETKLWVKQISGGGSLPIYSTRGVDWYGLAFSPDGNFLYCVLTPPDRPGPAALHQIPVLGGPMRKLLADIGTIANSSFSPDGRRIIFARRTSLMMANADGTAEQTFIKFPSNSRIWGAAWSPDGRRIAYAMRDYGDGGGQESDGNVFYLAERPAAGGSEKIIIPRQRHRIAVPVWLPDGRGLIVQMADETISMTHLYHVSYPDGALRQITQDTNTHGFPVLTADGKTLLIREESWQAKLLLAPMNGRQETQAVFPGSGNYTMTEWMPDGRLLYLLNGDLWRTALDGAQPVKLASGVGGNSTLGVTPDGRYITYYGTSAIMQLWRIDADGDNPTLLATHGWLPACSPDGRWMAYERIWSGQRQLWRVPLQGGTPSLWIDPANAPLSFSPDGKWLFCMHDDPSTGRSRFAILPAEGGKPVRFFDGGTFNPPFHWTSDSRFLLYVENNQIKRQPITGGVPQTLLTTQPGESVFSFAPSPGDKQLAFISGQRIADLILLTETK